MSEPEDYFAVERRLAGRLELEWSDLVLGEFVKAENPAARRTWPDFLVRPAYYHAVANWLSSVVLPPPGPWRVLDAGAGLGRFLVELILRCPQIESAFYVEPSPTLYRWAERILADAQGETVPIPFLKGLGEVGWHEGQPSARVQASVRDRIRLVLGSVDALPPTIAPFDLVTALNVLDQCAYPTRLAHDLLNLVGEGGHIALSSTYQFQQRFYIDESTVFDSLHDLFPPWQWTLVAEVELPFEFPVAERVRNRFLSHHVLYRRVP